jgi:uncharacterized iron-regulated membrane protein
MKFKKLIRQLHLLLGLASGLVVFTVAVTGSIYCFEKELRGILYSDLLKVKAQSVRKPLDELILNARAAYPKPAIKNIRIPKDPESSVEIILKNKQSVLLDPYSGKVLGTFNRDTDFFGTVLQIHRSLYLGETGKTITGISALIFTLMLISGIVLWWPGRKGINSQKFTLTKNTGKQKRLYDLHSVLGFYAAWIIIFTALTGLVWSFKWAERAMYRLNGSVMEERKQYHSSPAGDTKKQSPAEILSLAGSLRDHCDECLLVMPEDSSGVFRLTLQYDEGGFFKKSDHLFFDQYTGKLLKAQLFEASSRGEKMKATNYNIHTGKVFGLTGQFMVFFAALISASLPVTGFLMWRGKRKRKA